MIVHIIIRNFVLLLGIIHILHHTIFKISRPLSPHMTHFVTFLLNRPMPSDVTL